MYNDEKAAVVDDRPIGGDVAKRTHVVALQGLYEDGTIDAVYQRKAQILNQAIQEIGMGKYQVRCVFLSSERMIMVELTVKIF